MVGDNAVECACQLMRSGEWGENFCVCVCLFVFCVFFWGGGQDKDLDVLYQRWLGDNAVECVS